MKIPMRIRFKAVPIGVLALLGSALLLAFTVGWLAGRSPERVLAQAAPSGNGDVNADGTIDLSDAIGLINHLFLGGPAPVPIQGGDCATVTALVVRHAEKEAAGADPCLTTEGKTRADHLRDFLGRTKLDAIFATEACRTIQTVTPIAAERTMEVKQIAQVPAQAAALRALTPGSTALVAGHSFTIPDLLKDLGVVQPVSVPGAEYDNLWMVVFDLAGNQPATMIHLRY